MPGLVSGASPGSMEKKMKKSDPSVLHIGLHPTQDDMKGNWFRWIFARCIWDILHEWSFTKLNIVTDPDLNAVYFEATERKRFHPVKRCWSFLLLNDLSYFSFTKFTTKFRDGSSLRGLSFYEALPEAPSCLSAESPGEETFDEEWHPETDLESLTVGFTLAKVFPIDKPFAESIVRRCFRLFPFSKIVYNQKEERDTDDKNRITSFLKPKNPGKPVQIYEFGTYDEKVSWEVSFTFDYAKRKIVSFINGIETPGGGTHVDPIVRTIRQALRKTGRPRDTVGRVLSVAVSIHLPPESIITFEEKHNDLKRKLNSEHPEFQLISKELSTQMIRYFSE